MKHRSSKEIRQTMIIGRPFLITLIAFGYIFTGIIEVVAGCGVTLPQFLERFAASTNSLYLLTLGALQLVFGVALYKGWRLAWWFVVGGAWFTLLAHVFGGMRGETWAWGAIFWNILVLGYMRSRDVQAFFGREAY